MSWTQTFDLEWALNQHEFLCAEYLMRAKERWVVEHGLRPEIKGESLPAFMDISPETYVKDYFSGVQPTGDEFLAFLGTLGVDVARIKELVLTSFNETAESSRQARLKAEKFFHLFQTEWHVDEKQVKELIDESSVYHLIELAIADAVKTRARLSAVKRHAETNAMKLDVFQWLDENMHRFKSMDKAAEAVAGKVVPMSWRTVRDWIGEWKKLRSASKS